MSTETTSAGLAKVQENVDAILRARLVLMLTSAASHHWEDGRGLMLEINAEAATDAVLELLAVRAEEGQS